MSDAQRATRADFGHRFRVGNRFKRGPIRYTVATETLELRDDIRNEAGAPCPACGCERVVNFGDRRGCRRCGRPR